eukprot:Gregarina_sp_Pseudo_9__5536@NODE_72_length_4596_cov_32_745227_g66_i0_p1_GENE_NODE_72_length_4596_cov_32_745227_g66_i0NODE_72_length_4596_cov_32_745227_g66_i0_p1_ORF_typecomplete_len1071_score233_73Ank_5/PF13857_6/1_2e09Ank_5/PF13857_6/1_6e07Ank_2/PF12796_7/1_8e06Ank_2/PF12796_7/1_1e07Ank_4/PF13637_6/2_6e06Ank_4/PF13637_6/0_00021Ank_4/PF13637_6/2_4Ank/PF00023_30/2_8e06Ank/PF00023_30/0_0029Ank_3/PF13606_6/7_5e07Ank_3/PF13606_6/0_012Tweety/PF04906_13/0_94Tweety/PF04906_13/49Tweety/PF04906_13/0_076P
MPPNFMRRFLTLAVALLLSSQVVSGLNSNVGGASDVPALMQSNTLETCGATDSMELDKYGKAKIATGPLSWCFLRAIAAVTPVDSWANQQLEQGTDLVNAFGNVFTEDVEVTDILTWMVWGVTNVAAGVLWFLVCVFFVVPLLWCKCCRGFTVKNADSRSRTNRICNQVTFWICWALAFIFAVGLIYWSAWTKPDFNAGLCLPMKAGEDLFSRGLTKDGSTFAGLMNAGTSLDNLAAVANNLAGASTVAPDVTPALHTMWLPVTSFSKFLWEENTADTFAALRADGQEVLISLSKFGARLYDNEYKELDDKLFNQAANNGYVYVLPSKVPSVPGPVTALATEVKNQAGQMSTALKSLNEGFLDFYSNLVDMVDAVLAGKSGREIWVYAVLLVYAILPVFGLVAALLLFLHYKRKEEFATQSFSRWRRFAGFMIFGYAFWGIILFWVGGALMGSMYFPSDVCHVIDDTLDTNDLLRYNAVLGTDFQEQDVVDKCLRRDAEGDFLSVRSSSAWTDLDNALNDMATDLDLGGVLEAAKDEVADLETAGPAVPIILPVLPTTLNMLGNTTFEETARKLFCTGFEWEQGEALPDAVVNALRPDTNWNTLCLPAAGTEARLPGVKELLDSLNKPSDPDCQFCIYPYCGKNDGREVNLAVYFLTGFPAVDELLKDDSTITDHKAANIKLFSDPPGESVAGLLEQCAPDPTTDPLWWWTFYVSLQRSFVLYDGWTHTRGNSKLSYTQWNTPQPLFFKLQDQADPTKGSDPVTYEEWKQSYAGDFQAIVTAHGDPAVQQAFSDEAVSDTALGQLKEQFQQIDAAYNCRAVSLTIEEIKDSLCDSLSGDLSAIATLSVWLAVLHLIAFIVLLVYWVPRRRHKDKHEISEVVSEDREQVVVKDGLTEAEFFHACEVGDTEKAHKAADQYPPNSVVDYSYNNTPLHLAAYYGHSDITQDLCERGWDPNAFNFKRHTPFTACVSNLYLDTDVKLRVLNILKDHGAWVDVYTGEGDTPLMIATRANEKEIVQQLLAWDANPLKRDEDYNWSSLRLAESVNNHEMLELLKEASPRHQRPPHTPHD